MKPLDIFLLVGGAVMVGAGLYRTGMLQFRTVDIVPNLLLALVLCPWCWWVAGGAGLSRGAALGVKMTVAYAPMILMSFLIAGIAMVLITHYQSRVDAFLGGRFGLLGAAGAGIIMPTMTGMPIAREMWEAGNNHTAVLVFLLSSALLGFQIVLFRQPMLGWPLTIEYLYAASGLSMFIVLIASLYRFAAGFLFRRQKA